jgi:cysteinyl-tRNA synthetase
MTKEEAGAVFGVFKRMDEVLGVIFFENEKKEEEIPAEVKALLDSRAEARKSKNWAESDRLRDEIAALGWAVKDSKEGQACTKKQ